MHLVVELLNKLGPVFQADFEDLPVFDLGDSDKVEVGVRKEVSVGKVLNKLANQLVKYEIYLRGYLR